MRSSEKELLYVLSEFKTISNVQAVKFLSKRNIPEANSERLINYLVKHGDIFEKDGYLSSLPKNTVDTRMWTAFDVFLEFLPNIKENEYYAAQEPADILFLKDNKEYIIAAVVKGDEKTLSVIANMRSFDENSTYIIAVDTPDMIKNLPQLPARTVYALVQNDNVSFYEKGESNHE